MAIQSLTKTLSKSCYLASYIQSLTLSFTSLECIIEDEKLLKTLLNIIPSYKSKKMKVHICDLDPSNFLNSNDICNVLNQIVSLETVTMSIKNSNKLMKIYKFDKSNEYYKVCHE